MSTTVASSPTARKAPRFPRRTPQTPVSREAQRFAAAILEVLAGVRTPTDAAAAMEVSVPRYYFWEERALEGLVRACEPRPKGKVVSERRQIAVLEKEVGRLRQDCMRHQALVRVSQRTMGLAASPQRAAKPAVKTGSSKEPAKGGTPATKSKRKRRPVARALIAATALHASSRESDTAADSSSANAVEVVQRSVPHSSSAAGAACDAAVLPET